jgi:hypothetical protein
MFGCKRRARERKQQQSIVYQRRGYDYAAGRLLRGEGWSLNQDSDAMDWNNDFDLGMRIAIKDWGNKFK